MIQSLIEEECFDDPIVTRVADAVTFWPAEDYHQDYYKNNEDDYDCVHIITPKLTKLRKRWEHFLKDDAWFRE
jgi:peptide-methionine (S)-S-oxide reductase